MFNYKRMSPSSLLRKLITPLGIVLRPKLWPLLNKAALQDFDEQFYLKMNPDVAATRIHPYVHYINHGKAEGRIASPVVTKKGLLDFSPEKETVLVVSHAADRTGAPILALNICQELNKQFNVIVILLQDGNIYSFFEAACCSLSYITHQGFIEPSALAKLIKHYNQQHQLKFALVNSIESCSVLQPLAEHFIPSLMLIHEFSTYIRPEDKFTGSLLWAGKTVFSTKITQEHAKKNKITLDAMEMTRVLPQGKSWIPTQDNDFMSKEVAANIFRNNLPEKPFIVLGAGTVGYRKGVDLFIATAAEIKRLSPASNIRMLWVGHGFDPQNDLSYSCYLAEQIDALNLHDCFEFIGALADLEAVYQYVDVFYLSSRLDPLPNVAIDSMMQGIPLICFEKGSGAAEILQEDPDTATCIIPHMNIQQAARKIIDFYHAPESCALIANKLKKLAAKHFNMQDYVAQLSALAVEQSEVSKQELEDYKTLENSTDFLAYFCLPHLPRAQAIRTYIRSWHSKIGLRKPMPGFNAVVYDRHHHCRARNVEPFADYLRAGKPQGPWLENVITPVDESKYSIKPIKCALHIHAFYPEVLADILSRLQKNKAKCDLYISTTKEHEKEIREMLLEHKADNFKLRVVPNRGRDIGPLLTEFNQVLQQYDVIGHIHTKKSIDLPREVIQCWVNFLFEHVLGGQFKMIDCILHQFQQDANLGLVFPDDPHMLGWGENKGYAQRIAAQLGLSQLPEGPFNFPIGTMFWARPAALKPLLALNWSWDRYPPEPLAYDGSELHAIERLIPHVAANQGFKQAVTYIPGVTR